MNTAMERVETQQVPAVITPDQMLAIAVQQGADIDKLSRLMDLQERWEQTQARKAYISALANFRRNCPIINRQMKGHNIKYAGLADTLSQISGLMSENNLSHSWRTSQEGTAITVSCCVTHAGGHSETTSLTAAPDTSGSKNAIQAVGSTVSYLQRYTLFAILGLASKEQDDDGAAAGDPEGLSQAIDQIIGAETFEDLKAARKAAWDKFPKGRGQITAAANQRRAELGA
jgi:hypothetical protein